MAGWLAACLAQLVIRGFVEVSQVHVDAGRGEADALARRAALVLVVEASGAEPAILKGEDVVALQSD